MGRDEISIMVKHRYMCNSEASQKKICKAKDEMSILLNQRYLTNCNP